MAQNAVQRFAGNLFQSLFANAIYAIGFGVVTAFVARYAPAWSHPVLLGLFACLLGICTLLAFKAIRNLPPPADVVTEDTIEENVREWLYNTNLTVKRDPNNETYFRFLVTTDGGKKILLGRPLQNWSNYIYFRAELSPTDAQKESLKTFSNEELTRLVCDIKLEITRAKIANTPITTEGFAVSKRIPITHSLNEDTLISVLWEIEALVNTLLIVSTRQFEEHDKGIATQV